jgi:nitroreductase
MQKDIADEHENSSPLKRAIIKIFPSGLIDFAKIIKRLTLLASNYTYDFWRYAKYSSAVYRGDTDEKLHALITIHYHSIEKGLSLKSPRPGFGKVAIKNLLDHIDRYIKKYGPAPHLSAPLNALKAYTAFNKQHGIVNQSLDANIQALERELNAGEIHNALPGGYISVTRDEIINSTRGIGLDFFCKRHSVRNFSETEVNLPLLEEAIRRAQRAPAVCNRQSGKAWILMGKDSVRRALNIQNGARGFADQVNKVIIITSDQCNFQSAGERYQSWIDGGLFAMSLIYAIHSLGLGSCCLNWSMEYAKDIELKKAFNIPQSETIIMLLAVGHIPETLSIAESARKPIAEVMRIIS